MSTYLFSWCRSQLNQSTSTLGCFEEMSCKTVLINAAEKKLIQNYMKRLYRRTKTINTCYNFYLKIVVYRNFHVFLAASRGPGGLTELQEAWGTISTNAGTSPTPWCRVMTKKQERDCLFRLRYSELLGLCLQMLVFVFNGIEGPGGCEKLMGTCRNHPALILWKNDFMVLSYDHRKPLEGIFRDN